MERSIQRNGLINLLSLLLVAAAGFAVARYANSLAGQVSLIFIALGAMVAGVSWFQMRLEERERLEKLEFDELARSRSESALFESKEAEMFPARRSREQFERFFVPGLTILLFLVEVCSALLLWRWLSRGTTVVELREPMVGISMFGLFALLLFMLGKFGTTMARLQNERLLRPGGSFILLVAYLCFLVALGIAGVQAGMPKADYYLARGLCVLLALVAVETLVSLVLEVYRPRVKGKVERPLYESRLVGLLGQPEGLITTAAQALDYQFGFKVSETGFYRFIEEWLWLVVVAQLGVLVLSTAVVFIDAGQQGLLERFGKPVDLLGPGAHCKLPWPIDRVYRYQTEQIQSFNVGFTPDEASAASPVVVWTVAHTKEENFIVANREQAFERATNIVSGKRTPPVSLISVSIPVQFQITNLAAWVYNNEDAPSLLQDLATREVVRYLMASDMNEVMAHGQLEAAQLVLNNLQAAANEHRMGARIVFVGLQDIHPPVKVAPEYEKVVSAAQTKEAKILAARADDIRTNALAQARATNVLNTAIAESLARELGALAQAGLFTNQIPAFEASPTVYAQRAYLQAFSRATANARKYVLLVTNTYDVLQLDLQDRIREDILGALNVPAPKTK